MNLITDTSWGGERKQPRKRKWRRREKKAQSKAKGFANKRVIARRRRSPKTGPKRRPMIRRPVVRRPQRRTAGAPGVNKRWRRAAATAVAVAAIVAVIVIAILAAMSGERHTSSTAPVSPQPPAQSLAEDLPSSSAPTESAPGSQCRESNADGVITGAGPGDQLSGPGVIKAFDFAFYVRRDAVAVRAVAPNAVSAADVLQRAINTTPVGTTHCLQITDRGRGEYAVELTLYQPDGTVWKVYSQLITTAYRDGKFWVDRVRPAR